MVQNRLVPKKKKSITKKKKHGLPKFSVTLQKMKNKYKYSKKNKIFMFKQIFLEWNNI